MRTYDLTNPSRLAVARAFEAKLAAELYRSDRPDREPQSPAMRRAVRRWRAR